MAGESRSTDPAKDFYELDLRRSDAAPLIETSPALAPLLAGPIDHAPSNHLPPRIVCQPLLCCGLGLVGRNFTPRASKIL
jgi:hypothetical protein